MLTARPSKPTPPSITNVATVILVLTYLRLDDLMVGNAAQSYTYVGK
jgi:hypothetical protein